MKQTNPNSIDICEIRKARNEAETLRDRLVGEYDRLGRPEDTALKSAIGPDRFTRGCEAMRKAITAANLAIASINQALSQIERATQD